MLLLLLPTLQCLQITPKIEGHPQLGKIINQMIDNLLLSLSPEKLIRVTMMNNTNYTINTNPNSSGATSQFTLDSLASQLTNPNGVNIGNLTISANGLIVGGGALDLNNLIGRTAHICYLENWIIAYQLIQSILNYIIFDEYSN